ncbi:MAG: Ser-Thr-rich GPI-anchored membrane family protein [Candidatus Paceibacterota bacterium]
MKKIILLSVLLALFLNIPYANADTSSSCVTFTYKIFYGSRDALVNGEVSKLQSFLEAQGDYNYPEITGFFGSITEQAVKDFQSRNGVVYSGTPSTTGYGSLGPITREKIRQLTCGGLVTDIKGSPIITGISPNSGLWNSEVTINGSGFALNNNIVKFGDGAIINISSQNGTSLKFNVPNVLLPICRYAEPPCLTPDKIAQKGIYDVSVFTPSGKQSNIFKFNLLNYSTTTLLPFTPASLPIAYVGAPYDVSVSSLGGLGNYSWSLSNGYLPDGLYLSDATVCVRYPCQTPIHIGGTPTRAGVYNFKLRLVESGQSDNLEQSYSIIVSSGTSTSTSWGAPSITYVSPSSGQTGTIVTLVGTGFATTLTNNINFAGVSNALVGLASSYGNQLFFRIPERPCSPGSYCSSSVIPLGTYPISVSNGSGTSSPVFFTVTKSTTTPAIYNINPTSGPAGTTINVNGIGFLSTSTDVLANNINIGTTTTVSRVSSLDGVYLTFTLPKVRPIGSYPITISNANGTSNNANFLITDGSISVSSPVNGEVLSPGSSERIVWSSTGYISNVDIILEKLLINSSTIVSGGTAIEVVSSTSTLASNIINNGGASWTLGNDISPWDRYRIRIQESDNASVYATSGIFKIVSGLLTLSSPDTGGTFYRGKTLPISWSTTGSVPKVSIVLVNGTGTTTLATSISNTGSYNWTIPTTQALGDNYSIFVYNAINANVFGKSSQSFSIQTPNIYVSQPVIGQIFTRGNVLPIRWSAMGVGKLKFSLWTSAAILDIATGVDPDSGSIDYILPTTLTAGSSYYIKVIDESDTTHTANSGVFTIN